MPINLLIENIPDTLADRLRARAKRNQRPLEEELLCTLECAVDSSAAPPMVGRRISIGEAVALARDLFPRGTESSLAFIRATRDGR